MKPSDAAICVWNDAKRLVSLLWFVVFAVTTILASAIGSVYVTTSVAKSWELGHGTGAVFIVSGTLLFLGVAASFLRWVWLIVKR